MSRRYLTEDQSKSALKRGKCIEAFVGGFSSGNKKTIQWASVSRDGEQLVGSLWEVYDEGDENYLDLYSFTPANGDYDTPIKTVKSSDLKEIASLLGFDVLNYVNQGVVQDEYNDYLGTIT